MVCNFQYRRLLLQLWRTGLSKPQYASAKKWGDKQTNWWWCWVKRSRRDKFWCLERVRTLAFVAACGSHSCRKALPDFLSETHAYLLGSGIDAVVPFFISIHACHSEKYRKAFQHIVSESLLCQWIFLLCARHSLLGRRGEGVLEKGGDKEPSLRGVQSSICSRWMPALVHSDFRAWICCCQTNVDNLTRKR